MACLFVKLFKLTLVRSGVTKDTPSAQGWAVVGILLDECCKRLEEFKESEGILFIKKRKSALPKRDRVL